MKLSPILAQYLYTNKKLHLSGIGEFIIDPSIPVDPEQSRSQKSISPLNIKFEQDSSMIQDPELINYISQQTGKMRSLASADLESHLELARQFLNIGKPFQFEGIGTLVKTKSGFDFSPGHLVNEKMKDTYAPQSDPTSTTEESFTQYDEMFSTKKYNPPNLRKIAVVLAALAGLGLAVWAGYTIYRKGASIKKDQPSEQIIPGTQDSSTQKQDSLTAIRPDPGTYKFVIEKSPRTRALARFKALKSYGVNIRMETKDSLQYKLFFVLPAKASDTLRIRDSLSVRYVNARYMPRGKAVVE